MSLKEAFQILGVGTKATRSQVKAAFRKRARFFHPDRVAGSPEMTEIAEQEMKRLNAAYQVALAAFDRKVADRRAAANGNAPTDSVRSQPNDEARQRKSGRAAAERARRARDEREAQEAWRAEQALYQQQEMEGTPDEEGSCLGSGCGAITGFFVVSGLVTSVLSNCG